MGIRKSKWLSIILCAVMALDFTPAAAYAESGQMADSVKTVSEDLPQSDSGDSTLPEIVITAKNPSHTDGKLYYCEPPAVTVTDKGENLESVTATVYKDYIDETGTVHSGEVKDGKGSVSLEGLTGKTLIAAKDKAGNQTSRTIYITHCLGGRQSQALEANCTVPAQKLTIYICKYCGEPYDVFPSNVKDSKPLGHEFDESRKETKTLCGGGQITVSPCKRCEVLVKEDGSLYLAEDGDSEGHDWQDESRAADCENPGFTCKKCKTCGAVKDMKAIPALAHHYGSWMVEKDGNCIAAGIRSRKCTRQGCDSSEKENYYTGHDYSDELTVIKDPTCTETGLKGFQCRVCQHVYRTYSIPAKGHTYKVENDCTKPSECTVCHAVIPGQPNHNMSSRYQNDEKEHWKTCTNEGCTYVEKEEHEIKYFKNNCTIMKMCRYCAYGVPGYTTHDLSVYDSDETFHWRKCAREGCAYTLNKYQHEFEADDFDCTTPKVCKICKKTVAEASESHSWGSQMVYDKEKHWRECQNEGCNAKSASHEHVYRQDTRDCTKDTVCEECGYVSIHGENSHHFEGAPILGDEEGHYRVCQNANCEATERLDGHTGGTATCQEPKICEICRKPYGNIDPDHHVKLVWRNVREATEEQEGYTGDQICEVCEKVVVQGSTVPKLQKECEHKWQLMKDDEKCWDQCEICDAVQNEKMHILEDASGPDGHWKVCENCKYATTVIPHIPDEKQMDTDCTTVLQCEDCGYAIEAAVAEHSFENATLAYDEENHWKVCANPGCSQTSEKTAHQTNDDGSCLTASKCTECGHTVVDAMKSHTWSSNWKSDAEGHYQVCENIGCGQVNRKNHEPVEDDGLCTTPIVCGVCNYTMEQAQEAHSLGGEYFSDEKEHWQKCQNGNCSYVDGGTMHSGGTATCQHPANCQVCGNVYGETDPDNHIGDTEIRDFVNPTTETEGYSGDEYCTGCGEMLERGHVLEKLPLDYEHNYIVKYDGTHHWKECSLCGTKDESSYTEHIFEGKWQSDNAHHWKKCTDCDYIHREEHLYENGVCTVCDHTMNQHEHQFEWKYDEDSHWRECITCEEIKDGEKHEFGEWEKISDATTSAPQKQQRICEKCGKTETRSVGEKLKKTKSVTSVPKSIKLGKGEQYRLKPVIKPSNSAEKVKYKTSSSKIVSVSANGLVKAKKTGSAKITVISGSKKKVCKVTVITAKKAQKIKNVPSSKTMKKGKSFKLHPKMLSDAGKQKIIYHSSNKKIVKVSDKGKVTAKKKGTAVITVKSGKVKVKCKVTVK